MSKIIIMGYTRRGGNADHAVLEGEDTAVCGVTIHNVSDPFNIDSPWSCKRCVKIVRQQMFTANLKRPVTRYTADDMPALVALGYRRTSRKYGIISRVDRSDWKEFLARKGMLFGPGREGNGADHYRACYSKDKIELGTEFAYLALEVPTSGHDPVGFIPKDQLEQQAADAYAAACAECGRMRTTVKVLVLDAPGDGGARHVLLINGVAVIEFENGTEQAGKVYRALETEPPP